MLKFHIIIIKFSIFTKKNSQSDTFFPKLKNTIVKIDIKSFSVWLWGVMTKEDERKKKKEGVLEGLLLFTFLIFC